ncbi:MAG: FHA domain-containing protein [Pseudomonadota bacterium]|nr:FHA domain-containing protein [Candidatus Moranbacteria bacterium]MDP2316527.1 FHA domain-containing protein [Pseudomonadota bacterium]
MFTALVRFLLPDGRVAAVPAGGLLGRLATATLRFDDPRVSEAHALVSLRGERIWMLALRGPVEVDGKVVHQAPLRAGARVRLAEGVVLVVESLEVPSEVLVIDFAGEQVPLRGEVLSLVDAARPMLVPRFVEDALLRLWTSGIGWRGQAQGRPFDVKAGLSMVAGGVPVSFRSRGAAEMAFQVTSGAGLNAPLVVRTALDELRVSGENRPVLLVGGLPARIVRELADYNEPVPWADVARTVLGPDDEVGLRTRWDRNLKTLRRKLEEFGYRADLVRLDGHGKVSLAVGSTDTLEVV